MKKMFEYSEKYEIEIIAYCLMPNHYHFLIKQLSDRPIYLWIKTLFNSYVQALNKQRKRSGTLFEGRAKSKEIEKKEHLFHIMRYIHFNPVKANIVKNPENWEFSDYNKSMENNIAYSTSQGYTREFNY